VKDVGDIDEITFANFQCLLYHSIHWIIVLNLFCNFYELYGLINLLFAEIYPYTFLKTNN